MPTVASQIPSLIEEGRTFTYENFSSKSEHGYPNACSSEWLVWVSRVDVIRHLVGNNPAGSAIDAGLNVAVLGNGRDKFEKAKMLLLGGLEAATMILKDPPPASVTTTMAPKTNRVFIVHGHHEQSKHQLEILLHELGLEPIVLHRQADEGRTIIEKFEAYSDVGYAFILLTPDDIAYSASIEDFTTAVKSQEYRARPNVIFEFGFFVGKLGRKNVCCLHTGNVTLPSDVQGVIYKSFVKSVDEVAYPIIKELKAQGYTLKK